MRPLVPSRSDASGGPEVQRRAAAALFARRGAAAAAAAASAASASPAVAEHGVLEAPQRTLPGVAEAVGLRALLEQARDHLWMMHAHECECTSVNAGALLV